MPGRFPSLPPSSSPFDRTGSFCFLLAVAAAVLEVVVAATLACSWAAFRLRVWTTMVGETGCFGGAVPALFENESVAMGEKSRKEDV